MVPEKMKDFDYSGLSPDFHRMSKPAQRALVRAGIKTPKQLAKKTLKEVAKLHGMGPASFPALKAVLKKHGLQFKTEKKK